MSDIDPGRFSGMLSADAETKSRDLNTLSNQPLSRQTVRLIRQIKQAPYHLTLDDQRLRASSQSIDYQF